MFDWYKADLIKKLNKNSKVLIGLGDSFTQGQGSCEREILEKHNWNLENLSNENNREVYESFYRNSWVNQLCVNHLTDFIPINLGMTGRGNRAAVKELYLHPELKLSEPKEIIVVYMLTGMERFDFIHREFHGHIHFKTFWPKFNENSNNTIENGISLDYYNEIWSDRFSSIEMIMNITEAMMWCKSNNAKLLLLSAFRPDYQRDKFIEMVKGNKDDKNNYLYGSDNDITNLVDTVNWDLFVRPYGFNCVTDYLCSLEEREDLICENSSHKYYDFAYSYKKESPKGFITNCAHPSVKGHKKIAEIIYSNILKNVGVFKTKLI